MTDETTELRAEVAAALTATIAEAGPGRHSTAHPTLDELIAYHQRQLEDREVDRIQEHLVLCRECLERLVELDDFVAAGREGPPVVASLEEAAGWRALRPRLAAPRRTVPLALAASFLLAAIGLGLWGFQQRLETVALRKQLVRVSQPQPDVTIAELIPDSTPRGGTEKPPPVDLAAVDHLTVILHVPEPPDFAAYEAAITDPEGRELWRGRVRMDEYGTLALGIPRPFLDAGSYRIDLYGLAGESRKLIETFPLDLVLGDQPV